MSFKKFRRAICGVALAAAVGTAAALSGCTIETSHPGAEVTIQFNGETYVLEYTLYRNMYPQTVRHFMELAEAGFYDNTIIHDYTSNDWYGGGYAYGEEYSTYYADNAMDDYLNDEAYYKEDDYMSLFNGGKLTPTVYTGYALDDEGNLIADEATAYPTLIGEFSDNDHTVENGQRGAEFGALKMYYTDKVINNIAEAHVFVKTGSGQLLEHDYADNCATSLFALQVSSGTSLTNSKYATFAYLADEQSEDVLNDLLDAIETYIDDEYNGTEDDFVTEVGAEVDRYEEIAEQATSVSYSVTSMPIIIKTVKITKY